MRVVWSNKIWGLFCEIFYQTPPDQFSESRGIMEEIFLVKQRSTYVSVHHEVIIKLCYKDSVLENLCKTATLKNCFSRLIIA